MSVEHRGKVESRVQCQTIFIELPDGGGRILLADVTIDCPVCGQHSFRVAGHHLRSLRDFIIATLDEYPDQDLTGTDGDAPALQRLQFRGPGNDPATG